MVNVTTGAIVSLIKVMLCELVPMFPHPSVTVQFFVTERLQPIPCSAPIVPIAVNPWLQLSVTVAVPKAAAI